jgi:hypothetical protein
MTEPATLQQALTRFFNPAGLDRLVHHATLFELNVDSYRRRTAMDNKRSRGRPATRATRKTSHSVSPGDNDAPDLPCLPGEAG